MNTATIVGITNTISTAALTWLAAAWVYTRSGLHPAMALGVAFILLAVTIEAAHFQKEG